MICKLKSTKLNSSKYCYVLLTIQLNTKLYDKQFYFKQFNLACHLFALSLNIKQFYLTIDRTLSGASTLDQSGPGSNGNKELLCIPQSSSITGASQLNCLMSYPGLLLAGRSYPSPKMQSVYSTVPAEWAVKLMFKYDYTV